METIYHYTSLIHLEKILQDGYLKVSDADRKFGIKPAIWFSKNTNWEPTATKMVFNGSEMVELTQEEQQKTIGMVRFGIPFSNQLVSWRKYGHIGKIAPKLHAALEQIGIEKGARPGQWYCSFRNIPLTECVCIEEYDGSNWQSIFEEETNNEHTSVLNPQENDGRTKHGTEKIEIINNN